METTEEKKAVPTGPGWWWYHDPSLGEKHAEVKWVIESKSKGLVFWPEWLSDPVSVNDLPENCKWICAVLNPDELQAMRSEREELRDMTQTLLTLVRLKYGNLDSGVNEIQENATAILEKTKP